MPRNMMRLSCDRNYTYTHLIESDELVEIRMAYPQNNNIKLNIKNNN